MQQTLSTHATHNPSSLLRNTLLANACFSTLSGLLFTFDSKMVDEFLGLGQPMVILALGIGLLLFAAVLFWIGTRPQIDGKTARIIAWLDVAWVVGSVIILASGVPALSNGGWWAVAIVADIIAFFAILEFVGLRRLNEK